ncbi:hypothetical protein E6C55_31075 [Cohnella fermenti]|uniref:Type II secretion system protein GspF domain-containing protein n=1 Tax=Cohnella fermenti TaxID=2565925 RepID=A0A4S4BFD2_9BACL|nr:hypothetical protein E6C55_31075 [Cohnella fermenti]
MPDPKLAAVLFVLFLLLFLALRAGLAGFSDRAARHRRLHWNREPTWSRYAVSFLSRFGRLQEHLADLLAASGWKLRAESFALLSVGLGLAGSASGTLLLHSARGTAMLAAMLALVPYCLLRMRLIKRQLAVRLDFLPALELFYQCYLVTGRRHARIALQRAVEERRLTGEAQLVFEQLYLQLCVHEDDEATLRRFALAIGSVWADYFCNMLRVALTEGNDIADNLQELIGDMRNSRLEDQKERHRLLEIRIANFSPALFFALFIGINIRMNPEASYRYYLASADGRGMLLNAVVMLFASLLVGIYLSRRRL